MARLMPAFDLKVGDENVNGGVVVDVEDSHGYRLVVWRLNGRTNVVRYRYKQLVELANLPAVV